MWTKPTYVLGKTYSAPCSAASTQQLAEVAPNWEQPLVNIVHQIGLATFPAFDTRELAERLNRSNASSRESLKSFEQAYRDELCANMEDVARRNICIEGD